MHLTDKWYSKSVANESKLREVDPTCVCLLLVLHAQCWAVKLQYTSEKGGWGVLPREILKTKKTEEAISGHFAGAILPSEKEEFQRTLLPFIVCSF